MADDLSHKTMHFAVQKYFLYDFEPIITFILFKLHNLLNWYKKTHAEVGFIMIFNVY